MLDSEPTKHYCCIPYPLFPKKVFFVNESDWEVRYELVWYKEKELLEADLGLNIAGGGGNVASKFTAAEKAKPEEGCCFPHDTTKTTVMRGYKYFRLKYKFLELQNEWSEETGKIDPILVEVPGKSPDIKNFSIYEKIIFKQPPSHVRHEHSLQTNKKIIEETICKKLNSIEGKADEILGFVLTMNDSTPEPPMRDFPRMRDSPLMRDSPPVREEVHTCESLHKHMCSSNNKVKQCQHCKYWYCDWHSKVNNNPLGRGGHVCK
jgi:hypothetical protein